MYVLCPHFGDKRKPKEHEAVQRHCGCDIPLQSHIVKQGSGVGVIVSKP